MTGFSARAGGKRMEKTECGRSWPSFPPLLKGVKVELSPHARNAGSRKTGVETNTMGPWPVLALFAVVLVAGASVKSQPIPGDQQKAISEQPHSAEGTAAIVHTPRNIR